jgi:hypothetical protein
MKIFRYIFIVIIILCQRSANAQATEFITGNFNGYHFPGLVREIERQTPWHIYYDSTETDSIEVNLIANHQTLTEVLDIVFRNTDFHYAITKSNEVFVSKRYKIQTTLPANYFNAGKEVNDNGAQAASYAEDLYIPKTNITIAPENKLYVIGSKNVKTASATPTVAGYVRVVNTGEPIIGATISVDTLSVIKTSDQFGYYNLSLSLGRHILHISSAGMKDTRRQVTVYGDGKLNIDMEEFVASLKAVIVSAEKNSNVRSAQMGVTTLNIQTVKQVPVVFGEADVLRVLLTLPGVTSVGEGSNGFNVRGGAAD